MSFPSVKSNIVSGNTINATDVLDIYDALDGTSAYLTTIGIKDTSFTLGASADTTKRAQFLASGITAGQTRIVTLPDSNTTIPIISQILTISGPTAARTITVPDANFTVARTDAANTFTGASTASAWVLTSPTITTSIVPTANDGAALGSTSNMFSDLFLASGAVIDFNNGDVTLTHSLNTLTLGGGDLALGANNLTMTGSLAATGARITKGWFTDLESTNMPTVGGTAILTSLTAPQFTTIELGHASDTTLSRSAAGVLAVEGVVIPSISSTNTFTNKFITPQLQSVSDAGGTFTPVAITNDMGIATALSQATTIAAPTGSPVQGEKLIIRLKDNGTARALTWNAIYRAGTTVSLPTTTTISKTLYVGFIYNSTDTKWDLVAYADGI